MGLIQTAILGEIIWRSGYDSVSTDIYTGSNEKYKAKNIYDIAGNMREWTMELGTWNLATRGGSFDWFGGGVGGPASYNDGGAGPSMGFDSACFGFRPAMYIK